MNPRRLLGTIAHSSTLAALTRLRLQGALVDCGWFRSYLTRQSVDARGLPLPWYTYAAIALLTERLPGDARVFEYGAGNSTRWYGRHAAAVVSVEHDPSWADRLRTDLPDNCHLVLRTDEDAYVNEIAHHDAPDLVAVDGHWRGRCLEQAAAYVSARGVIVLDNALWPWFATARERMEAKGFRSITLQGMAPIVPVTEATALFYRDRNCLGL